MNRYLLCLLLPLLAACAKKVKQQEDELYSRHLQRKVQLTILTTPPPDDRAQLNLLLLNDGQDIGKLRLATLLDSLYKQKALEPLVVVAIHAGDRMQEYGVAGKPDYEGRGKRAGYYDAFINNELYPYAKKKAGVRKFKSVVIAGISLGGLSAFDIGWTHADKIDKVGVFSGAFWWRDKDVTDPSYSDDENRILLSRLKASRKKPGQQYWFYTGGAEENSDRDKDGIIDVTDDTKDLVQLLETTKGIPGSNITYTEAPTGIHDWPSWSRALPGFLVWAFGKK